MTRAEQFDDDIELTGPSVEPPVVAGGAADGGMAEGERRVAEMGGEMRVARGIRLAEGASATAVMREGGNTGRGEGTDSESGTRRGTHKGVTEEWGEYTARDGEEKAEVGREEMDHSDHTHMLLLSESHDRSTDPLHTLSTSPAASPPIPSHHGASPVSLRPSSPPRTAPNPASLTVLSVLFAPLHPLVALHAWLRGLVASFGLPFVALVGVVYGVSEGYAGALYHFASQYYWMDVQRLQPASAQAYMAVVAVPWDLRPIYGLISDSFPIRGYRQRPYLFLSALLGLLCSLLVALLPSLPPTLASLLLAGTTLSTAFADVLVDGLVAAKIRTKPQHAGDLQALPWGILALSSLLAFALSGPIVSAFGARGAFFFYALAPFALLVTVLLVPEAPVAARKMGESGCWRLKRSVRLFVRTLRNRVMWRAAIFLFMSHGGISPDIPTALIYWYTKAEGGPRFSKDFMGVVFAMGRVGLLIGVFIYHRCFKAASYRTLLFFTLLLLFVTGFLDLVIITRVNITLGIPDHFFVLGDTAISDAVRRLELMPILVLAARLCPPGIEATLFAFCMSLMVFGEHCAAWQGALMLHLLGVRKDSYERLWLAVVLRNLFRLLPMAFLWLLPEGGPDTDLLGDMGVDMTGLEEESERELMVVHKMDEDKEGESGDGGMRKAGLEEDGDLDDRATGLEVLSLKETELVI